MYDRTTVRIEGCHVLFGIVFHDLQHNFTGFFYVVINLRC